MDIVECGNSGFCGRQCTPQEKGDLILFMQQQKN